MVDRQVVEEWLNKADEDLLYAKASLEDGLEFYSQICFHLHQAVEKYLKAYIISNELSFRRIHDLSALLKVCIVKDQEFSNFKHEVEKITPFYIKARYPDFIFSVGKEQASNALKVAQEIATFVKTKLS